MVSSSPSATVTSRGDIEFAVHDGVSLKADLWAPSEATDAPVLIAVHGGAWQIGERSRYVEWGPYFARRGYALFTIDYRASRPERKSFPEAVCDVRAAVQFVRANAAALGVDPERIALIGDSAGAHLSALVALAWNAPVFAGLYGDDPHAATPAHVKAVVGFYGVYDMLAQWEQDQLARSGDLTVEKFLGCAPRDDRRVYFDASPLSYATCAHNATRFLLIDGTHDDIVDTQRQAKTFLTALKHANFVARSVIVPGAGHFWITDPIEEPGSYCGSVAPRILRFLASAV